MANTPDAVAEINKPATTLPPIGEDGVQELNPPDHTFPPPYNIQGGKDAAGVPSTYEDLFGYRPQVQQIQDSVVNNVFNGGSVSTVTVVNDILANQVFGP